MKTIDLKSRHPLVSLSYFVLVIGYTCFFMHPVSLFISLLSSFSLLLVLKGGGAVKIFLTYMMPIGIIMATVNPIFNHQGITIITYLPGGNPLTLESIIYGLSSAVMIVSVICYFSCFNNVITNDALMYLFGKITPSLSLIFSMTLRFVPKFLKDFEEIKKAQKCQGLDLSSGNILKRAKKALSLLSIATTQALENSVETSDSMKARGYGLPGRTSFSIFNFTKKDALSLAWLLLLGAYSFLGTILGGATFSYFPSLDCHNLSPFSASVFMSYFALCIYPVMLELWEVIRWKSIKSKI